MSTLEASRSRSGSERPPPARDGHGRRRPLARVSPGHLVMVVAALLAALANVAVLRAGDDRVPIVVARSDLAAGTPLDATVVHEVAGRLDASVLATLVAPAQLPGLAGHVTIAPIRAGAPIRVADLRPPAAADDGLRRMSVPVPAEHAVGGVLQPGDRVDVIRSGGPSPGYLLSGAPVLAVAEPGTGLGGVGGFHVTVAVDPDTALCLASAIAASDVMVLLSTGQPPVEALACTAPAAAVARPDRAGG